MTMKRLVPLLLMTLLGGLTILTPPVHAQPPLTIGLVVGPEGLARDVAQADDLAQAIAAPLQQPLKVRLFVEESQLHQWLNVYREVDFGWLSDAFARRLAAGEVLALAAAERPDGSYLPGLFVARQGLDADTLRRLSTAIMGAAATLRQNESPLGFAVSRFTAVPDPLLAPRPQDAPLPVTPAVPPPAAQPVPTPPPTAVAPRPTPTVAAPGAADDSAPVALEADQFDYDRTAGTFRASGGVLMRQGDMALAADGLLWQEATGDVMAEGDVRLSEPTAELAADSLQANLVTGLGRATDGRVLLRERNFHLAGAEVERLGEVSYRVTDGRFTTCDGDVPDWQFSAGQADVTLGRYAVARDVWFEVREQPLLYLPYLLFPVKSERESGFLLPRVGYSSRKGAILSLAWYEAIDRHLDATVYLDYLSRLGVGKGVEYRYAFAGGNLGEAFFYHVGGIGGTPDSYALDWRHEGLLPGGFRLAADVEYVDRKEFFEDFGEAAEEYNRDQAVSTVMVQRNLEKLNFTGFARYIRDLENDNGATLQRLPELGVDLPFRRLADGPFHVSTALRATSFRRETGDDGQRLWLRQGAALSLKPGDWLELTPEVALYARAYEADTADEIDLLPEYSLTLSTRLQRVFAVQNRGFDRLRHSIEPEIRYRYVPNSAEDDLPFFDSTDRLGPLNQIEYALVNRLTARYAGADGTPTYRELLNLRLSQDYDIRQERDDAIVDGEPFSPLRTELTLRPSDRSRVEIDASVRVHDDLRFTRVRAGADYGDGRGNGVRAAYHYRAGDGAMAAPLEYLEAGAETAWLAPVHVALMERYDFLDGRSLETVLGLEYRAQCWSLFLTFRDRPEGEEIMVGFALSGLGRVGGFGSRLNSAQR